jgi:hypothetical protein
MEYSNLLGYKRRGVSRRARGIKNGAGPLRDPRRRDIAPTGELAGLPARDAPKSSEDVTATPYGRGRSKSQLNGVRTGFTGANPQCLFQFKYPYLSIRGRTGPGNVADRFHDLLRDRIVHR